MSKYIYIFVLKFYAKTGNFLFNYNRPAIIRDSDDFQILCTRTQLLFRFEFAVTVNEATLNFVAQDLVHPNTLVKQTFL